MLLRTTAATMLVALLGFASLAACGGDDDVAFEGPAATITVTETGFNILHNGLVMPTGEEVELLLLNEREEPADLELFAVPDGWTTFDPRPDHVEPADEQSLAAGEEITVEVVFDEPGTYTAAIDPVSLSAVKSAGGTFTVADPS